MNNLNYYHKPTNNNFLYVFGIVLIAAVVLVWFFTHSDIFSSFVKENVDNKVDCELKWGGWTPCISEIDCDTNKYNEYRKATVKTDPQNGGLACGELVQYRTVPQHCKVEWSDWNMCTVSDICPRRLGTEIRKGTIIQEPKFGGLTCPENLTEYRFNAI